MLYSNCFKFQDLNLTYACSQDFESIMKCIGNLESEDSDDSFIILTIEPDWNGFSAILVIRTE